MGVPKRRRLVGKGGGWARGPSLGSFAKRGPRGRCPRLWGAGTAAPRRPESLPTLRLFCKVLPVAGGPGRRRVGARGRAGSCILGRGQVGSLGAGLCLAPRVLVGEIPRAWLPRLWGCLAGGGGGAGTASLAAGAGLGLGGADSGRGCSQVCRQGRQVRRGGCTVLSGVSVPRRVMRWCFRGPTGQRGDTESRERRGTGQVGADGWGCVNLITDQRHANEFLNLAGENLLGAWPAQWVEPGALDLEA